MALSITDLRKLADTASLKYFLDPDQSALMAFVTGIFGRFQVVIMLHAEGQFLQFRTIGYLSCPRDHANLGEVLRLLTALDYQLRMVKFGWDEKDGEIVVYVDNWLMDASFTQQQFERVMRLFFRNIDLCYPRIKAVMDTGQDPGEVHPDKPGALSDQLREALQRLRRDQDDKAGKGAQKKDGEIDEL